MEISNNQRQTQPRPISTVVRIFCCITLYACSAAAPLLLYYIGTEGIQPAIPLALGFAIFALCAAFILVLCKKPLFLGCAIAGALVLALLSPFFSVIFLAMLCATVACAALSANALTGISYLPIGAAILASYGTAFALTHDPLLAAYAALPVIAGLALGASDQKKRPIILSVGIMTGAMLAACLTLTAVGALLAGMQPSVQGVTEYVKSYHAAVSAALAESVQLMAEMPEIATQLSPMLGGSVTPESIQTFSDSVASAILGMLPGMTLMMTWIFGFIAHRGFTALTVRGLDKKDYPAHLTAYAPSVPTAILMLLCYAALVVSSLITGGEMAVFVSLNLLLCLLPMMTVCGILSIVANIKHAKVKWPLLLTYTLSVIFLGVAVVPMIAFFGSFAVITQALAAALEKKLNNLKGGE